MHWTLKVYQKGFESESSGRRLVTLAEVRLVRRRLDRHNLALNGMGLPAQLRRDTQRIHGCCRKNIELEESCLVIIGGAGLKCCLDTTCVLWRGPGGSAASKVTTLTGGWGPTGAPCQSIANFTPTRGAAEPLFDPRADSSHTDHAHDMQLLSSRAVQAQTYTCASCAILLNLPIRRTAITPNRLRKPTIGHVPTASYTTVLTSATPPDSRLRPTRRNDLRRLSRAGRSMVASRHQASSLATEDEDEHSLHLFDPVTTMSSICKSKEALSRFEETEHAYRVFLQDLHSLYDKTNRRGRTRPRYPEVNLEPVEGALKKDRESFTNHREAVTEHQFERYHDMINKLVDDLIKQAYFDEHPEDPALARRNIESLDSAWTAIRLLRSEGYPRYTHPAVDPIAAREARDRLSETIDYLFERNRDQIRVKPKFQVAKICYNLLVCKFPPTIHHYNALILGFSRQDMPNLVDLVAASLLHNSRLRSTTMTVVCLFLHYRKIRDIQGFYGIIRRLVAVDPRGILRTRRWISPDSKNGVVSRFVLRSDVVLRRDAMAVEIPERTMGIYDALMIGLLSFDRTKDAVKVLHACMQEGVGVRFQLFSRLCRQIVYRLNAPMKGLMTRVILDNLGTVKIMLRGQDGDHKMTEWLWSLLSFDQIRHGDLFEQRVELQRSANWMYIPYRRAGPIRTLTTALFIRHSMRVLCQLQSILRGADKLVHTKWPMKRTFIATKTIEKLDQATEKSLWRAKRALKYRKLFRLVEGVEKVTWGFNTDNTASTHKRTVRMLLVHFPNTAVEGSSKHKEHLEKLEQLADNWLRHRIRRKEGVVGPARRLAVEIELSLYYGERLLRRCHELVGPSEGWERERRGPPTWPLAGFGTRNLRLSCAWDDAEADWLRPGSGLQMN